MEFTENALVLRVGKFKENDLWVSLLTATRGIITVFAFGGSRSFRRFAGCLDSYNYIIARVTSSKNGQFLNLQEASLIESYIRLRSDWNRQGMVANCIRFLEALGISPEDAENNFLLVKSLFELFDKADNVHTMFPLLYRFRLAAEQGYVASLSHCAKCQKQLNEGAFYATTSGHFLCKDCKEIGIMNLFASKECLDILQNIQEYSPIFWQNISVSSDTWREMGRVIDSLVRYHVGLEWSEGRFKRSYG